MTKRSAGILLYRPSEKGYDMLIVHPGGPFWAKKDAGSWSIPKGEYLEDEEPLVAAKREFTEEVGAAPPDGDYRDLGEAKQASGKLVRAFALESDFDLENFQSNVFTMEWPPKSGQQQEFPENDKAAWVSMAVAKKKLVAGQVPLLETLAGELGVDLDGSQPKGPDDRQVSLF
jgi:predicted NUDIX family NTP pyrophosphohydrolase